MHSCSTSGTACLCYLESCGTDSHVERVAGTSIKPESSAAFPDDGVPAQAVKQSTPVTDAFNGADGGNRPLTISTLHELGSSQSTP